MAEGTKTRLRAAAHRKATLPQRAAERIELEGQWHEEFESGKHVKGKKGLTYAALAAKCQEEGEREDLLVLKFRNWEKATWMKHKSRQSKTAARARYRASKWAMENSQTDELERASSSGHQAENKEEQFSELQEDWPEEEDWPE